MTKEFNPDSFPDVEYETIRQTQQEGLRWISLVCEDTAGAGQYFNLFVRCVPREGEEITLLDGSWWKVTRVTHTMVRYPEWRCLGAMVYVVARRIPREPEPAADRPPAQTHPPDEGLGAD